MKVTIYTSPHCKYSKEAKDFLKKKKVEFIEKDIVDDVERQHNKYREEMIDKTGQLATPVLEIGSEVLIGFNEKEIEKALDKKEK